MLLPNSFSYVQNYAKNLQKIINLSKMTLMSAIVHVFSKERRIFVSERCHYSYPRKMNGN